MKHSISQLPKNQIKISFELTAEDLQSYLEDAAKRISESINIPGFRSGHAPYQVVVKKVGEMKILEEALEPIVRKSFIEVVLSEKLETVGSPKIDIEKMAPGNNLVFSATISILPKVIKLADYKSIKVEQKKPEITEKEVDKVISDLQKMQTKETRDNHPITKADRVVIDMDILKDGVVVEGGTSKGHSVFLNEEYYIPGFTESLLNLKENDEKTFTLSFPEEHYNKMLAGKPADFRVKIKEIYTQHPPELNDEFAKSLGKETLAEIKALLKENLLKEKLKKEEERFELEILSKIREASQFEDMPDLLLNEEVERMRHELEHSVGEQGLLWADYLKQIKKTEAELKLDLVPQAIERIKTSIMIREIAKKEGVEAKEEEIDEELDKVAEYYKNDEQARNYIYSPDYREQMIKIMQNRKTIAFIKECVLNKEKTTK